MTKHGLHLRKLQVTGSGKAPAEVSFKSGLNVIAGPSNTGKSYIFELLDFLLGGAELPRDIVESHGYETAYLELNTIDGRVFTLERALSGGAFQLYTSGIDKIGTTAPKVLKPELDAKDPNNISTFLLELSNINAAKVRMNSRGKTQNLSFRTVAPLFVVGEERIITKKSPIVPEGGFQQTAAKSAFKFLLTGQDDSAIVPLPDPKISSAQDKARLEVFDRIIAELRARLDSKKFDIDSLSAEIATIEGQINLLTVDIAGGANDINERMKTRSRLYNQKMTADSRLVAINQLLTRFQVLAGQYDVDLKRLDLILESDYLLHQLTETRCPTCQSAIDPDLDEGNSQSQETMEIAYAKEYERIQLHSLDLQATSESLKIEREERIVESKNLTTQFGEIDQLINTILSPKVIAKKDDLLALIQKKNELNEFVFERDHLNQLIVQRGQVKAEQTAATSTTSAIQFAEVPGVTLRDLSDLIHDLLKQWQLPQAGTVEFDRKAMDILVAGRSRKSNGKGVRAIMYSAFCIALMYLCERKNQGHPQFLVFDSPLTTYKQRMADGSQNNEDVSEDVQQNFFESLASISKDLQIIVLDNKSPTIKMQSNINYIEFVGDEGSGRHGFFPTGATLL